MEWTRQDARPENVTWPVSLHNTFVAARGAPLQPTIYKLSNRNISRLFARGNSPATGVTVLANIICR